MEVRIIGFPTFFIVRFRLSLQGGMSIETLGITGGRLENILNVQRLISSLGKTSGHLDFQSGETTITPS